MMRVHSISRTPRTGRQHLIRFCWLVVAASILLAVLAYARVLSRPAVPQPTVRRAHAALVVDPATQSVLDYLSVHTAPVPRPTATRDPAQQSVQNYLDAHGVAHSGTVAPWERAVQAVRKYLYAHK